MSFKPPPLIDNTISFGAKKLQFFKLSAKAEKMTISKLETLKYRQESIFNNREILKSFVTSLTDNTLQHEQDY